MKSLQIFKQLRAFSARTVYACMIGVSIFSVNGCKNTNDEQIIPKEQPSIQSLAKTYNLKEVKKPTDSQKIIYLKDATKVDQFFQNLKWKKESQLIPNNPQVGRVSSTTVLSHGLFTFMNGQTASIYFNTASNGMGEIINTSIEGQDLAFTQSGNYVEMIKWGYIAVHYGQDEFSDDYFYYLAPVTIYRAILVNGGWSCVQSLNQFEQANFEGESGTWAEFYISNPF